MQRGIPEWLDTETYYEGSVVTKDSSIYISLSDNNTGNAVTNTTYWRKFYTPAEVDALLALKVAKAGDTMTGNLIMDGATVYNKVSGTNYRMLDARDVHITETYLNGTSWYRVWSDGWCEQGSSNTFGTGVNNIALLKNCHIIGATFSWNSQNYNQSTNNGHIGIAGTYPNQYLELNTGSGSTEYCTWVAYGYL